MSLQFHWGGQVSADIQAQNQMLFDAMTPEQQQRVLAAQAERAKLEAEEALVLADRVRIFRIKCACLAVLLFLVIAIGR